MTADEDAKVDDIRRHVSWYPAAAATAEASHDWNNLIIHSKLELTSKPARIRSRHFLRLSISSAASLRRI